MPRKPAPKRKTTSAQGDTKASTLNPNDQTNSHKVIPAVYRHFTEPAGTNASFAMLLEQDHELGSPSDDEIFVSCLFCG